MKASKSLTIQKYKKKETSAPFEVITAIYLKNVSINFFTESKKLLLETNEGRNWATPDKRQHYGLAVSETNIMCSI
jgi:hypothetical protein